MLEVDEHWLLSNTLCSQTKVNPSANWVGIQQAASNKYN